MEKIERKFKKGPYRISEFASHIIISEDDQMPVIMSDTGVKEGFVFMPLGEMKRATTSLLAKSHEMYDFIEFLTEESFWGQIKSYHYKGETLEVYAENLLKECNRTNKK